MMRRPSRAPSLCALLLALGTLGCITDEGLMGPRAPAPEPMSDADDWVRLTSGEWLKGEFERLQNDKLVLDSQELDELVLDWEDVEEVWSPNTMACLFDDLVTLTGPIHMVGDEIRIGEDPPEVRSREELITMVREGATELESWRGRISVGLTSLSGNTDQEDLSWAFDARRDRSDTSFRLRYQGLVSSVNGDETANNHYLRTSYTSILSARTYVTPILIDAWRDRFKNVSYQVTPAALLGYKLVDDVDREWNAAAGLGAQHTKYRSVQPGEDDTETIPVALLLTEFDRDVTSDWDVGLSLSHQAELGTAHENTSRLQASTSLDLTDRLDFEINFTWSRVGNPREESDGTTPDSDDTSLSFAIAFEF
jgi:hypothetical protein